MTNVVTSVPDKVINHGWLTLWLEYMIRSLITGD